MGNHAPVHRRPPPVPFPIVAGILALGVVVAVVVVALGGDDGEPPPPTGSPSIPATTGIDPGCEAARQEMVGLYETVRAAELEYVAIVRQVDEGTPAQDLEAEIRASTDAVTAGYDAFDAFDPPDPLQDDRLAIRPSLREFQALADRATEALIGEGESPGEAIAERLQNLYDVQPDAASITCD